VRITFVMLGLNLTVQMHNDAAGVAAASAATA
jgi:hypothetical protein